MSRNSTNHHLSVRFGDIMEAGHTVLPNVLLKYQATLGINANEFNFIAQIWYHWWSEQDAYPAMSTIAKRMGAQSVSTVRRYSRSLQQKGYLVVIDRVSKERGQLSSQYDFSPLIIKLNQIYQEERAKEESFEDVDWVASQRINTPYADLRRGGYADLTGAPYADLHTEEDEETKKTQLEEDTDNISNSFELQTQILNEGNTSKFSKKREKINQTAAQGIAEPQELRRSAGGMMAIGELLERHHPSDAAVHSTPRIGQPARRGRPPKYPATPAIEGLLSQWTGELRDDPEHARSNISQAARLWHESGVSEDTFRSLLYEARDRTKKAGNVEKLADGEAGELGLRNRMPYFFACLKKVIREDLQRQVNDRAPSTGKAKSSSKKSDRTTNRVTGNF